jgi:hypothetical protein
MNLPKFVTVGPYDIAIELVEGLENFGEFEPGVLTIRLRAEQPPQLLADTLLHELIHAIHFTVSHKKWIKEEQAARWYAGGLLHVARDNPELARWFEKAVKGT